MADIAGARPWWQSTLASALDFRRAPLRVPEFLPNLPRGLQLLGVEGRGETLDRGAQVVHRTDGKLMIVVTKCDEGHANYLGPHAAVRLHGVRCRHVPEVQRSEEHTSELQSHSFI